LPVNEGIELSVILMLVMALFDECCLGERENVGSGFTHLEGTLYIPRYTKSARLIPPIFIELNHKDVVTVTSSGFV
jgi:hypothetical protein